MPGLFFVLLMPDQTNRKDFNSDKKHLDKTRSQGKRGFLLIISLITDILNILKSI